MKWPSVNDRGFVRGVGVESAFGRLWYAHFNSRGYIPLRSRKSVKSSPATSTLESVKPFVTPGRASELLGTPSSFAAHDLLARRGQAKSRGTPRRSWHMLPEWSSQTSPG